MSIAIRCFVVSFAVSALAVHSAVAQPTTAASAPVPSIISSAQRVFISNAGSDSYGSEGYLEMARYSGGPNRFYNQLYAAIKTWVASR